MNTKQYYCTVVIDSIYFTITTNLQRTKKLDWFRTPRNNFNLTRQTNGGGALEWKQ